MAKSILKYAGGKSQLIKYIYPLLPKEYGTYFEPFLGGGSLYFFLTPQKSVISDINGDLMNTYRVVQQNVDDLIDLIKTYPINKDFYIELRARQPYDLTPLEAAARFIYLNKTCYNGLYRVNSKQQFNVPWGNYKNPKVCDEPTLRLASNILQGAEVLASSFDMILKMPKEGDLVYLDPPYVPVSETSFVSYSREGFGMDRQAELAKCFRGLSERGVKCLLSNSDTEWVRDTYSGFEIVSVQAKRSINSNGAGRGKVSEVLVKGW